MSKKRFKDGLESLFGAPAPEDERVLIVQQHEERADRAAARKKKGRSRKNFTSDLDSLFAESVAAPAEPTPAPAPSPRRAAAQQRRAATTVPPTGLDALIRRTTEERLEATDRERKRLTLTLDRKKVMKLKTIARQEKAYLRDIVGDLVEDYINNYERRHGSVAKLN